MKKLYSLGFALVAFLAVTSSCKNEEDNVFGKSATERINEEIKHTKDVLTSAKNGWCLEFFGKSALGGYNVLLKFGEDNKVTASSELEENVEESATSHYVVTQSKGVLLSFDTYNKVFHKFSAPVPDNDGMLGEVEYRVMRVTPDSIFLAGKKHEVKVVMVRMDEKTSWKDYLTQVHKVADDMITEWYEYAAGKDTQRAKSLNHTITLVEKTQDGNHKDVLMPYIVKPDGIHFYKPYTVNGKVLTGFKYPENSEGEYAELKDKSVTLKQFVLPLNEQFTEGEWYIDPSKCGGLPQKFASLLPRSKADLGGESLQFIGVTRDSKNNKFAICFRSGKYGGFMYMNYEYVGKDGIKLTYANDGDGNGKWYFKNTFYMFMPYIFAGTIEQVGDKPMPKLLTKEWVITADNVKKPTVLTFTEKNNTKNVVVLSAKAVEFPFGR